MKFVKIKTHIIGDVPDGLSTAGVVAAAESIWQTKMIMFQTTKLCFRHQNDHVYDEMQLSVLNI